MQTKVECTEEFVAALAQRLADWEASGWLVGTLREASPEENPDKSFKANTVGNMILAWETTKGRTLFAKLGAQPDPGQRPYISALHYSVLMVPPVRVSDWHVEQSDYAATGVRRGFYFNLKRGVVTPAHVEAARERIAAHPVGWAFATPENTPAWPW